MPFASLRSRIIGPLDASNEPCPLPTDQPFSLRDRGALRSDPGQSQSGNSTLSPGACRAEARPPNWPYRRFDRSPLSVPLDTAVGAPSRGAKVCYAGGGRTDRWPQITTIPLRAVLQGLMIVVNWMYQCDIGNPGLAGGLLPVMGLAGPGLPSGPWTDTRSPPPATERG
jgi:hypothetical protein